MIISSKGKIIFWRWKNSSGGYRKNKCRVGLGCRHFWFVGCAIEFNPATNEGLSTCNHLFQFGNYRIDYAKSFDFHNNRDGGQDARPTKNKHQQITEQANQGKGKRKGGGHLAKNHSIRSTYQPRRMEGFPSQWNVWNQLIGINPSNLVEG